jgi:transposase
VNSLARDMEERKLAVALVEAYQGRSLKAAAAIVGIGAKRASSLLRRYKVRPRDKVRRHGGAIPSSLDPRTAATPEEAAERKAALVELASGLSVRALAEVLGTSRGAVSRLLRAAGIQRRRGRQASIGPEEVQRLRTAGWTYQAIADVLGRSRRGVSTAYRDGQAARRKIDPEAVVRWKDEHGLGWDDIGQQLGCHRDTARHIYHRAKKAKGQMLAGNVGCSEQNIVSVPSR